MCRSDTVNFDYLLWDAMKKGKKDKCAMQFTIKTQNIMAYEVHIGDLENYYGKAETVNVIGGR